MDDPNSNPGLQNAENQENVKEVVNTANTCWGKNLQKRCVSVI